MKKVFTIIYLLLGLIPWAMAQSPTKENQRLLPQILLSADQTLHLTSPEPITYVDISTDQIIGDLPLKNLLRIKLRTDSGGTTAPTGPATLTIVGESFIAQYLILPTGASLSASPSHVDIQPDQMMPLDVSGVEMTTPDIRRHALEIIGRPDKKAKRKQQAYGVELRLNGIYTSGELIFIDIGFRNHTNLQYTIDQLRFKIEDKKINKATNVQSVEVRPIWQFNDVLTFKRRHRNVLVFKKVSYPSNKVLKVELTEKQISGRTVTLELKYGDLLRADSF